MKFTVRQPQQIQSGEIVLKDISIIDIQVQYYSVLSIDGSTSNTGLSIMRESDGALMYLLKAEREKDESPVRYKIQLKRTVEEIIRRNRYISQVIYEEPVVSNIASVKNLFMLRTFVEEIIIENEPEFDTIKHIEIPNMRWKRIVLQPDKIPQGTEKQKEAVRVKIESMIPFIKGVTQDEIDCIGIGWAVCAYISKGIDTSELESKKKVRPFRYELLFIGATEDESAFMEFSDVYKGPASILENGIQMVELNGRENFEKKIYETIGNEDKLAILKYESRHFGNIALQHRIGNLVAQYPYIYAVVWRKTRKY